MQFIWKWLKRLVGITTLLLVISIIIGAIRSAPIPSHPFTDIDDVLVIAHRGGRGLWPENTLYAFEEAIRLGVDVLEFDVHCTSDSVMVVIHDATIDRTTDGSGRVEDQTWDQIQKLDAGYRWTNDEGQSYPYRDTGLRIPTFEDVLKTFPDARMNIELKASKEHAREMFLSLIKAHHSPDLTIIASFQSETILYVRENNPQMATAATIGSTFLFWVLNSAYLSFSYSPDAQAFQVPPSIFDLPVVSSSFVQGAHDLNVKVHVWTINDQQEMKRLLETGVDGIMTDYPDRLLSLLGRKKKEIIPADSTSTIHPDEINE